MSDVKNPRHSISYRVTKAENGFLLVIDPPQFASSFNDERERILIARSANDAWTILEREFRKAVTEAVGPDMRPLPGVASA